MYEGLLSSSPACYGQLLKILITLEPYGIFESNFAYLFILIVSSHWYVNSDEGWPSIVLVGGGLLVNMLITLEPHGIFKSNFAYQYILTFIYRDTGI